ncbi:MAG TPA: sigma-70 family RNA polymerase sigma factor [Solirubrobacteraceae bacterium]|jgi:RNA polymerase sigma-70 factor (ECF subfamily)|nr:sigma-70 family RNA polymerase sigma factor [Solirubrobacteraceae bacterium]
MDSTTLTARAQFEALFRSHYRDVHRFALRRIDASVAEEIATETFTICWAKLDSVPDPALPWLYGVARNCLANRRRRIERHDETAARVHAERGGVDGRDPAERFAERDTILRAFTSLSEPDREALRLVAWEGLALVDAARAAGTSRPAFAMRVHRARRRLAAHLNALEGSHRPADRLLEEARDAV